MFVNSVENVRFGFHEMRVESEEGNSSVNRSSTGKFSLAGYKCR
jgi:hypothetical protein